MKILIVAVNSKYIHTSLSVRSLKAYASSYDVDFMEFTINERIQDVLKKIYKYGADVVAFSCYIWNIEFILKAAASLKKISPDTKIIFGGPEVSFDSETYMKAYDFIDAIMRGEGEEMLVDFINNGYAVKGITYRREKEIVKMPDRPPVSDLNSIPFPYTQDDIYKNKNKLIYYESSRGCPFNCSYCLSSTIHSVRFRDINIVKNELRMFIKSGCRIIKFVDRTFNADRKRAEEIIRFLIAEGKSTQFHFEIAADLINSEIIALLKSAPKNMFLLEIGVQSTNARTIEEIDRKTNFSKIAETVKELKGYVHMHLDLIAGLPYEGYASFIKSFNDVMQLQPEVLQLGFLKLLRGTKIRRDNNIHDYKFTNEPPYEILSNKYISYDELLKLKEIEYVLDKYYNSEIFSNGIKYLLKIYDTPYELFKSLSEFLEQNSLFDIGLSQTRLYEILSEFCDDKLFKEYLKLDYFINVHNPSTPEWANKPFDKSLLKKRFDILTDEFVSSQLPEYKNMPTKEIIKHISFEQFSYDVVKNGEKCDNILIFDKKYNRVIRVIG